MKVLSITGIATVALLSMGLVSDVSAQGRGRGQDKNRARGLERARQVANENSRLLRGENSRLRRVNDDSDSDSDSDSDKGRKKLKKVKNRRGKGGVIGETRTTLPSGVCIDRNGDGICDTTDRRRPRRRTDNGGPILGRRTAGSILGQQVGSMLLQRAQLYGYRLR